MAAVKCNVSDYVAAQDQRIQDEYNAHLTHLDTLRRRAISRGLPSFATAPRTLLQAYEDQREASPLGEIFKIANYWHDHADTVIISADEETRRCIATLKSACCHPHHNLLSRAQRGSKPRVFPCDWSIDNDALSGLLDMLNIEPVTAWLPEHRWAVVQCGSKTMSTESLTSAMFLQELLSSRQEDCSGTPGESLLIFVDAAVEAVEQINSGIPYCLVDRDWSARIEGMFAIPTVLAGAILGLDCIQYLAGAMSVTDEFMSADAEQNRPLQLAALLKTFEDAQIKLYCQPLALGDWAHWYVRMRDLVPQRRDNLIVNLGKSSPNSATVQTPLQIELVSNRWRTDLISQPQVSGNAVSVQSAVSHAVTDSHGSSMRVELPEITTHTLGELTELFMLAWMMETS